MHSNFISKWIIFKVNTLPKIGCSYCRQSCWVKEFLFLVIVQLILQQNVFCQQKPAVPEQLIESVVQQNADADTDDEGNAQQLQQFVDHPLNLNTATEADLNELGLLSPEQIHALLVYRNILGKFIHIYEIQAVPHLDVQTIEKIRLYVTVSVQEKLIYTIKQRMKGGDKKLLLRMSQTIEKSKGFIRDTSVLKNGYAGSPQKLLLRYKYQFKNLLQYGLVAEKDAGEQFFKGKQKQGFDFYSAHLFIKKLGKIKFLALGDFTVNLGQGLIICQNLAFKKSADVLNIKRQMPVLRPYSSAGEYNFLRGAGITLSKKNIEITLFSSYRKLDANLVNDTTPINNEYVSSFLTAGYHRTKNEIDDRANQHVLVVGGNATSHFKKLQLGVNAVKLMFSLPLKKAEKLYNLYAPSGKNFMNYSIDYSYTYRNWHLFGETALNQNNSLATINGLMMSVHSKADLSFLYRNISPRYSAFYSNAFTEQSTVANENGIYMGVSLRPISSWKIDAYVDFYKFPWLKYQINKPVNGADYLLEATYKPNKQLEMYIRYKNGRSYNNMSSMDNVLAPITVKRLQNVRTHIIYKYNKTFTIRNRNEFVTLNTNAAAAQNGFLTYLDVLYKPLQSKLSGNFRIQYFETDGYESRLYAFENDVLYSTSIPVIYDAGLRYYINCNYDVSKKMSVWIKWAQSVFSDKTLIGSGLDLIEGNKKSEIKIQLEYNF